MTNGTLFPAAREAAWQNVKDNLETMLTTLAFDPQRQARMMALIGEFVDKVEEEGLHQ